MPVSPNRPSTWSGRWISAVVLLAAAVGHVGTAARADAFVPPSLSSSVAPVRAGGCAAFRGKLSMTAGETESSETGPACWNPQLRREIASVSTLGAAETAWLAYDKVWGDGAASSAICGANSAVLAEGCGAVLDGPYAAINVGGVEIPLSAVGFVAYALVTVLALEPLLLGSPSANDDEAIVSADDLDVTNRLLIIGLTTIMATFSAFLMGLLFGVLRASCPFCILSATLSLTLGTISWFSGMLPSSARRWGAQLGLGSFVLSTAAALALFLGVSLDAATNDINRANSFTAGVVANAAVRQQKTDLPAPPVMTHSTERTMKLASDLESLDARMFGAYWCSHCYEQKERLGLEAMQRIPYVECAKEGLNSQRDLCKEREVPGYPTWEVAGELYPGEMELDELESMVKEARERLSLAEAQK